MQAPDSLIHLQKVFGDSIRTPLAIDADGYYAQPQLLDPHAVDLILHSQQLPARARLCAYNEQYWYRLLDSLEEDLPVLKHQLGQTALQQLCSDFLNAYPSIYNSLRDLPLRLPQFIAQHARWNTPQYQQIIQHALIVIELYDDYEDPVLDTSTLSPEAGAALVHEPLLFQHSWCLFREDWNIIETAAALHAAENNDDESGSISALIPQTSHWAFCRVRGQTRHYPLSHLAYQLLELLAAGQSILSACASLEATLSHQDLESMTQQIQTWFQEWASNDWFAAPPIQQP